VAVVRTARHTGGVCAPESAASLSFGWSRVLPAHAGRGNRASVTSMDINEADRMTRFHAEDDHDQAGYAEDHLAERAAAGDTEATEALLASLRPWALQLARYRMIGHRGHITPDDVVQDTLLYLWRRIRDYEMGRPVRAWVRVMLESRIHSVRRQAARQFRWLETLEPSGARDMETEIEAQLRLARVRAEIDLLPPPLRDAILGLIDPRSHGSLSSTARGRVRRARQVLRSREAE